jgi:hypothetical protein
LGQHLIGTFGRDVGHAVGKGSHDHRLVSWGLSQFITMV